MSKFEIFNLSFGDNYNVKKVIKLISESFGKKKFKYKLAKGTPGTHLVLTPQVKN